MRESVGFRQKGGWAAWRITADLPPPYLPHDGAIGRLDGSETPGVVWQSGLTCAEGDIHAQRLLRP